MNNADRATAGVIVLCAVGILYQPVAWVIAYLMGWVK